MLSLIYISIVGIARKTRLMFLLKTFEATHKVAFGMQIAMAYLRVQMLGRRLLQGGNTYMSLLHKDSSILLSLILPFLPLTLIGLSFLSFKVKMVIISLLMPGFFMSS